MHQTALHKATQNGHAGIAKDLLAEEGKELVLVVPTGVTTNGHEVICGC